MLFRLPLSWLSDYVAIPKQPRAFANTLSRYGVSVERVEHVRHEFSGVVVGRITEIVPHPNADKLRLATVTVGGRAVRRIVCGAPNIAVGHVVPVALPGALLPSGIRITRRMVRGVVSDGMLCSARELGLHDDHVGIFILSPKERLGKQLARLHQYEDDILEVEPTTNRPDLASIYGVAREVHAITKARLQPFPAPSLPRGASPLHLTVADRRGCQRVCAVVVEGVSVAPSPWWMQERLVRAGLRPINVIVDITNYIMLECGQPMHVYDADAVGQSLTIRRAKAGEAIVALNGQRYGLNGDDLITVGAHGPADLAGVMGSEHTGVSNTTTRVIYKVATWDPVLVRRMSRKFNLYSAASRLFEKGLSTALPPIALARALALTHELAGGHVNGGVVDVETSPRRSSVVTFPLREVERTVGITLSPREAATTLGRLGFSVRSRGRGSLRLEVPYWREHDVTEAIDVVEELARLTGYHTIASALPQGSMVRAVHSGSEEGLHREAILRRHLELLGFTEVCTYSLVSARALAACGVPESAAIRLRNPLSSDGEFLRPSLLPSLIDVLQRNLGERNALQIFEIASVYQRRNARAKTIEAYRRESTRLVGVVSSSASPESLFREIKGVLESLFGRLGVSYELSDSPGHEFATKASAGVVVRGATVGSVGLLRRGLLSALGISSNVVAIDLSLADLARGAGVQRFTSVPKFPAVKRDLSLVMNSGVRYTDLARTLHNASPLLQSIELFDIYRGAEVGEGNVSYALHLTFRADDRTLTVDDVAAAETAIASALSGLGVRIRN